MRVSKGKNGFNLVEAAIVLGVIGLVIGGIWIAAAQMQMNRKITQTMSGVLSAIENYRRTYAGFSADQVVAQQGHGYLDGSAFDNIAGWQKNGLTQYNPFGNEVDSQIRNYSGMGLSDGIQISFYDVSYADCMALLPRFNAQSIAEQLYIVNTAVNYHTEFPFSISSADCTNVSHLDFVFRK